MKNIPLVMCAVALGMARLQAETFTYPDLVKRTYDLEHLAVTPPAGEKTALASSYDRRSQYDAVNDKYIDWAANGDGGGIIRKEGDESVLAEITGPGCIWRIWSASPGFGHVKIYLDGNPVPVVDLPLVDYFSGKADPFNRPNLVYRTAANGFDNFVPIPFQKSCKIVADPKWGNYYHFNYTVFPKGTTVPTFQLPLSPADEAALNDADKVMASCGVDQAGKRAGEKTEAKSLTVSPGQAASVADLSGPAAITALKVRVDGLPKDVDDQTTFLRKLAIRITWDGQKEPAVWAPLGDFFADAAGAASYLSLPMGVTVDGQWYSYWYMPFASAAKVEVVNDGDQAVSMTWEVTHAPLDKPLDSLLRFHAKWHRDAFVPERKDRFPDWTLLETKGIGRYVGTQLHIWNPAGGWWGEGDEKFFIDGEKFPSTYGTGSEDYFGYAWSSGKIFKQALHGQPVNESNTGHISAHRWHIADNVPFQQSFEGILEKYFPNTRPTIFAAVAYWYLSPDGVDPYEPATVADRIGYWVRFFRGPGAIEAEGMKVLNTDAHPAAGPQAMFNFGFNIWSANSQLWWQAKAPGDKLELALPVKEAGNYHVLVRFTSAPNYGITQTSIDGTKLGSPVDLYAEKVSAKDLIDLGVVQLISGNHSLGFEITGKNDASKGCLSGIDYVKLVPVEASGK